MKAGELPRCNFEGLAAASSTSLLQHTLECGIAKKKRKVYSSNAATAVDDSTNGGKKTDHQTAILSPHRLQRAKKQQIKLIPFFNRLCAPPSGTTSFVKIRCTAACLTGIGPRNAQPKYYAEKVVWLMR